MRCQVIAPAGTESGPLNWVRDNRISQFLELGDLSGNRCHSKKAGQVSGTGNVSPRSVTRL